MKKLFVKLLSVLSAISMIFFSGCVEAMSCENTVKYLSSNSVYLAFDKEFWLFGQCVGTDHVWQKFMREMCQTFKHYMVDMWCEVDPYDVDSVNFIYLVLYVYRAAMDKVSTQEAEEVVRNMWRSYRNDQETANDRIVLDELSKVRSDLEFKNLKSILDTISI